MYVRIISSKMSGRADGSNGSNLGVYAVLLAVQFMFSGYHIVSEVALSSNTVSPYMLCFTRELIAVPLLFLFAILTIRFFPSKPRIIPEGQDVLRFIGLGATGIFGNQIFFLLGLQLTSPTNAAIMQPLIPVMTSIISLLLGYEPPLDLMNSAFSRWKVLGIVAAVGGAIVMMLPQGDNSEANVEMKNPFLGNIMLISNCFAFSLFVLLQKPLLNKYSPPVLTSWAYFFGSVFVAMIAAPNWIHASSWSSVFESYKITLAILYAAFISSALAIGLVTWANGRVQGVVTTLFQAAQPFSTAVLSLVVFGTMVTPVEVVGAVLIICGLILVCYAKDQEQKKLAASSETASPRVAVKVYEEPAFVIEEPLLKKVKSTPAIRIPTETDALLGSMDSPLSLVESTDDNTNILGTTSPRDE
eukprot:TRINITY_DN4504_c0_g1_i4.p1 TRINITY_DN4504_c0_g1~~TRINITY_DN4504_c0_g1_i4.p1  ORF type:complete len:415 (+),score=95.93 TRINITY_DN4504_c0_g1_i4:819-2063(+)